MEFKYKTDKIWLEDEQGKQVACIDFPMVKEGVVSIDHTEVNPSLQGQGIASKITEALAIYLRENHLKTQLRCSYAIRWFGKHPEYEDVLEDVEKAKQQFEQLAGPACGIRQR